MASFCFKSLLEIYQRKPHFCTFLTGKKTGKKNININNKKQERAEGHQEIASVNALSLLHHSLYLYYMKSTKYVIYKTSVHTWIILSRFIYTLQNISS